MMAVFWAAIWSGIVSERNISGNILMLNNVFQIYVFQRPDF
jgi:hypothetical protein